MQLKTTRKICTGLFSLLVLFCTTATAQPDNTPYIVVLGVAQDAGYPQIACAKACCRPAWADRDRRRSVAALGLVDPVSRQYWLIDATPDIRTQLHELRKMAPEMTFGGVFLTHAHIGHYTGLMHFGREAMGARDIPVFAMPRMRQFLSQNGPWELLLRLHNISLKPLSADSTLNVRPHLSITPMAVPHRDEYSETVGFRIEAGGKSVLYIPDIDKWDKWQKKIEDALRTVDVALLDGSFYEDGELPNRDMSEIPHPFISESMRRFDTLAPEQRSKVVFIHFNHTNPVLQPGSQARREIEKRGYNVATQGMIIPLAEGSSR